MKTKQPKRPAAPPTKPQPGPTPDRNQKEPSLAARFIRLIGRTTNAETISFFTRFLDECERRMLTPQQVAFSLGVDAMGFKCLDSDIDAVLRHVADLDELYRILWLDDDRTAEALRGIARRRRATGIKPLTLDDMLGALQDEMQQEECDIDSAREILKRRPDAVRNEIREAITKHPEILQEKANAR